MSERQEQFSLSQECSEIIKSFTDLNIMEDKDEIALWEYLKEFYEKANRAKNSYHIEDLVESLLHIKINIQMTKDGIKEASRLNQTEKVKQEQKTILMNYADFANIVEQIKTKALQVENYRMFSVQEEGWANPFLLRYYDIISSAGSFDDSMRLMESTIIAGNNTMIRTNLLRQRTKLWFLAKQVRSLMELSSLYPKDILEQVLGLNESIRNILKIYEQETTPTVVVATLITMNEDLQKKLRKLYEETLKKLS
jgi:hypothetical protein